MTHGTGNFPWLCSPSRSKYVQFKFSYRKLYVNNASIFSLLRDSLWTKSRFGWWKKSNFQVSSSLNFLFSWEFKSTLPSKSRTKKSFPRKVVKQNSENFHDTMKFLAEISLNVLMTECLFLTKVLRSKSWRRKLDLDTL